MKIRTGVELPEGISSGRRRGKYEAVIKTCEELMAEALLTDDRRSSWASVEVENKKQILALAGTIGVWNRGSFSDSASRIEIAKAGVVLYFRAVPRRA